MDSSAHRRSGEVNGVDLHWLEYGPSNGPLAVLLHGFPDTAETWRHLAPELADAGFRVAAPWMRGYAPSGLAPDDSYQVGALAADAEALVKHLGANKAVLVGHDWGAIAGYAAAASRPELWTKLVTLAVPPIGSLLAGFLAYRQARRSWYMFLFQHELAATIVAADDLAFLDGLWAEWSPGYDATDDLIHVKDSLRDHTHLNAALGYYRAMLGSTHKHARYDDGDAAAYLPTPIPTLYLHGAADGCMGVELVGDAQSYLPAEGSRVEVVDGVGHFLHLEAPATINPMIMNFLAD